MVSGPTEQLRSVYAKLDRAEMQLYEAKGILRDYLSGEPYTVIPETDPVQGFRFYVKGISPPLLLSVVAGELLHNLRSCLDHLAWQLASLSGNTGTRATSFPIHETVPTAKDNEPVLPQILPLPGVSLQVRQFLAEVQPYQWGEHDAEVEHPLCLLNSLNNFDKHRTVVYGGERFGRWFKEHPKGRRVRRLHQFDDGVVFEVIGDDMQVTGQVTLEVGLRRGPPSDAKLLPVFETLMQIFLYVRDDVVTPAATFFP